MSENLCVREFSAQVSQLVFLADGHIWPFYALSQLYEQKCQRTHNCAI